jgi:hypothetical protein
MKGFKLFWPRKMICDGTEAKWAEAAHCMPEMAHLSALFFYRVMSIS